MSKIMTPSEFVSAVVTAKGSRDEQAIAHLRRHCEREIASAIEAKKSGCWIGIGARNLSYTADTYRAVLTEYQEAGWEIDFGGERIKLPIAE